MAEFSYELPSSDDFYEGLKVMVKSMKSSGLKDDLSLLLNYGNCELVDTSHFSGKRWNATGVIVRINTQMKVFSQLGEKIARLQNELVGICDRIMPANAGFDVVEVSISPLLDSTPVDPIKEIIEIVSDEKFLKISEDLIAKGKRMANAYVTLYALENHIRNYIDTKLSEKVGDNYMAKINVSRKVKAGIEMKKGEEQSRKWLPVRGDKDLYYADFIELSDVIVNNWDYFKGDIPDQEWIKVKMKDMYDIRCLVAHNSYISDDNMKLLEITTKQIIAQLYS